MLLSRRSFGALAWASAIAGGALWKNTGEESFAEGWAEGSRRGPLLATPLKVPHDFVGMHAHRWPGGTSSAPAYPFGTARSHDFEGAAWYHVHSAPDHFQWSRLDEWVEANSTAGRTLIYTLYGTPEWLAARTDWSDLYGQPGGGAPPRDLNVLATFIKALVTRYNGYGRRRIHFIETWNEPHFRNNAEDYWWGSAPDLAALGRTCWLAAKQVDPALRVLSPGFAGALTGSYAPALPFLNAAKDSSLYQYLTANDGAGGNGSHWCDGIAFHLYNIALDGMDRGYVESLRKLQHLLRRMNLTLPLYNTELGFLPPHPFRSQTPAEQACSLRRIAVMQAAAGVRALCLYAHDDDLVGNPSVHPEVAQAITEVHAMIAGQTLLHVQVGPDGSVHFTTKERSLAW